MIWIFFLVGGAKKVSAQWMPLLVWHATKFNVLRAAFWIGTADTMTPVEIIAALMFMLFMWCQIVTSLNIQYEYHVSAQMNGR